MPVTLAYNRVGADADLDASGDINDLDELGDHTLGWFATGLPVEDFALELMSGLWPIVTVAGIDQLYQAVGDYRRVSLGEFDSDGIKVFTDVEVTLTTTFEPNDTLVPVLSAAGSLGGFGSFATSQTGGQPFGLFIAGNGRNHATVADEGVAAVVAIWLKAWEKTHGDLR